MKGQDRIEKVVVALMLISFILYFMILPAAMLWRVIIDKI